MTKTFRDNCDKNIVQQTSCQPLFTDVQMQLKMYFFFPFPRQCIHYNYGGISVSHACNDCMWLIRLDAELYTTCPEERVLVVMTHQVQCSIPTFEAVIRKNMHMFLQRCRRSTNVKVACFDAVRLFIFFLILRTLQPHFFVTECSDNCSVCSFEGVHVTMHSYFTWPWPVWELASHSAVVLHQVNK